MSDGFGMPAKWALSIVIQIFKRKVRLGTVLAIELFLGHGMKVVVMVL